MKKLYTFLTLLLVSGVIFAQHQNIGTFTAIKADKEINTLLPTNQTKAVVDSMHYDGAYAHAMGTGSAGSFGAYTFFSAATLAPHIAAGHKLQAIKLYINDISVITSIELRIYSDSLGANLLYSQPFTPILGWNNVPLSPFFTYPGTDIYAGYYLTATTGYPVGCDAGPAVGSVNWIDLGGWMHLSDLSVNYNWNIRLMCGPLTPIASCTPLSFVSNNIPLNVHDTSEVFTLKNTGGGTLTCSYFTPLGGSRWTSDFGAVNLVNLTAGQTKTFTFIYTPTQAIPSTKTVTITTNGGTITIALNGNGVDCSPVVVTNISESFESTVFPPACWTKQNPDLGTGWEKINSGTTPLPDWTNGTMSVPPGGGTKAAYCTRNTGGTTYNNQYLISKQFTTQTNPTLTFSVFWYEHFQDFLDIKVSTTTNNVASFTTTVASYDTTNFTYGAWKQFVIPLSFASQNIYVAFNEHCANKTTQGAFIAVDLFRMDDITGIEETPQELIAVFPNPANDKIFITGENVKSVQLFNILGENVGSYGQVKEINVSNLTRGFYFVRIITDGKIVTRKINIAR